jgi:hypothetical protein
MGIAGLVLAAALQSTGQDPARHPQPLPDPIVDAVRIEIRLTSRSSAVNFAIPHGCVIGGVRSFTGPSDTAVSAACGFFGFGGVTQGVESVAVFRAVLLADDGGQPISLSLRNISQFVPASFAVFNVNDEARPVEIARGEFVDRADVPLTLSQLRSNGPLAPPHRDRLVLAHYYPWWDPIAWADRQLLDQPLRLYSNDSASDVAANLRDVADAGIDAVIVSYQGSQVGGGWNLRRLRLILDAAQQAGLQVTVQLETLGANFVGREGATPDADVLHDWIAELVDTIATHPAWLKVDGRPVIFAYVWGFAGDKTWQTVLDRLHAANRRPLMMADSTNPAHLRLADGLSTYAGTLFAPDVTTLMRDTVSATRLYHQLGAAYGPPRVAVSTVMPGYDETRLRNREGRVVPREDGAFYDRQWQAAVASGADWVVISTWNEWAENTQIEAGQRFGALYVWRTRFWSAVLHGAPR